MKPATIPAAHLDALGGMQRGDPPVETASGIAVSWHQTQHLSHRMRCGWTPDALLMVEQSMPTLLRALARQYGAKLKPGEVPTWATNHKGRWWLRWGYPADEGLGPVTWRSFGLTDGLRCDAVPTLTEGMGRLESLAAVIAWQVSR